jgi:hypothetical protein
MTTTGSLVAAAETGRFNRLPAYPSRTTKNPADAGLADRLYEKARHYEALAASFSRSGSHSLLRGWEEWRLCAIAWTVVAISLRELASIPRCLDSTGPS